MAGGRPWCAGSPAAKLRAVPELPLERRFDHAMHELYSRIVREAGGYNPTRFFGMMEQYGGLEAAHRLLKPDADFFSYGFEHLSKMGRSDLTMEALILTLDYKDQLFSSRELATAEQRLQARRNSTCCALDTLVSFREDWTRVRSSW